MPEQLPLIPNIDHLRKQAKDLLRLCRAGDVNTVNSARSNLPVYSQRSQADIARSIRLSETLDLTARSYGFSNWNKIYEHATAANVAVASMSAAMADNRLEELEFRSGLAARKGLPPLGSSFVSSHGVRYDVVDFMPAISGESAARV